MRLCGEAEIEGTGYSLVRPAPIGSHVQSFRGGPAARAGAPPARGGGGGVEYLEFGTKTVLKKKLVALHFATSMVFSSS